MYRRTFMPASAAQSAFPPGKAAAPAGHGAGLFNLAVVPAVTVGVPLLVVRYYAFSNTALAITQSAMSAGGLLGGVLAGAFAKRLSLRRGTAALWCITAVCALLGLAVLPCVPAAAGTSPSHHWLFA